MRIVFSYKTYVAVGVVCVAAIVLFAISRPAVHTGLPETPATHELELASTEMGYSLTTLTNDAIQFGVDEHTQYSYLLLEKWDGAVQVRIEIPYKVATVPQQDGKTLVYTGTGATPEEQYGSLASILPVAQAAEPRVDVAVRAITPTVVATTSLGKTITLTQSADGGIEFDTIFYQKPSSNKISFPMETSGLDFYYQPPLSAEPIPPGAVACSDTACWDTKGNIRAFRPENVVGSYAAYYKDYVSGDYSALGGKNYKTGKVFDIYRPLVYDAVGNKTWGQLEVSSGELTVIVPQEFLDAATYPVTVDPTFGFTSIGGSTLVRDFAFIIGSVYPLSEAAIATSISFYTIGSGNTQFAIYDNASPSNFKANTGTLAIPSSAAWVTGSISSTTLSAGSYHIVENRTTGGGFTFYYDSASGYSVTYKSQVCCTWPSTISSWSFTGSGRPSAYVTYTVSDSTPPTVSVTAPIEGGTASSTVTMSANASDETGVEGVSFYVNGTLQGSEDTSAPYSISWDSTATTSSAKSVVAVARDAANNFATSTAVSFTVANEPTASSVSASTTSATASISWSSATAASTRVWLGLSSTYSTSTSETDTGGSRTISHSATLTGLKGCTRYHFAVVGTNAGGDTATSTDDTFATTGCTGGADISATSESNITTATGGTLTRGNLTLTVPSAFTATSSAVTFQANQIDATAFFAAADRPDRLSSVGSYVFHLSALIDATTTLAAFDAALSVLVSYSAGDVDGINEDSLQLYRYDGSAWYALSDCSVDTNARTVTCTTTAFSDFALFGTPPTSNNSTSSVGGALLWCSGPFAPGWNVNLLGGGCDTGLVTIGTALTEPTQPLQAEVSVPSVPTGSVHVFMRTLRRGTIGADIYELQKFLNANGVTVATSGPGSPGEETYYFGQFTHNAVVLYQDMHAAQILVPLGLSKGTGIFGASTRSFINSSVQ